MKKYGKLLALLLTLTAGFTLTACGDAGARAEAADESTPQSGNSDESVKLRIGYHYSAQYQNQIAVAEAKGYLAEAFEGLNVETEYSGFVGAGPAINEAFLADEIDVAVGLGDQPAIAGIASGNDCVVAARIIRNTRGSGLVVRYDSEFQTVSDLKGKTIAVGIGTAGQKNLDLILEDYGLKETDVELVNIMQYDAIVAAFEDNDIDAAINSSLAYTEEEDAEAHTFRTLEYLDKHPNYAYIVFKKQFVKEHRDVALKFLAALYKANDWYYANVEEGDRITAEFLELTDGEDFKRVVTGNAKVELMVDFTEEDVENLRITYDFLKDNEILPNEIEDLSTVYDSSLLKEALAVLDK